MKVDLFYYEVHLQPSARSEPHRIHNKLCHLKRDKAEVRPAKQTFIKLGNLLTSLGVERLAIIG
jgi:hypothetical protein